MPQAKTLDAKELRRVFEYVATRAHAARNRAMVAVSFYAGLRVKEIASLYVWDVVDRDGNVRNEIRLDADQTKGRRGRVVFVSTKLQKELARYIAACPPKSPDHKLFYTQKRMREGFNPNSLANLFYHLYRGVGYSGVSSHSGRHTFLSTLHAKSVGIKTIMELAGHRHLSTTSRYLSVTQDQLRAAVELI